MWFFRSIGVAGLRLLPIPRLEGADILESSFQNTDLDYQLRQREITNLVMGGLTANTCLESTARFAYEL
jgi:nicotinamidase-related amidase